MDPPSSGTAPAATTSAAVNMLSVNVDATAMPNGIGAPLQFSPQNGVAPYASFHPNAIDADAPALPALDPLMMSSNGSAEPSPTHSSGDGLPSPSTTPNGTPLSPSFQNMERKIPQGMRGNFNNASNGRPFDPTRKGSRGRGFQQGAFNSNMNPEAMAQYQAYYQMQMANRPPPYFSLDVECVATGPKHDSRAVAQVALVDQWERVLLNFYVKPQEKVFSYLPMLTGLNENLLSKGVDIQTAIFMVKSAIPPNAILVGQNILKDVTWLQLQEGRDFGGMMDLSGLWRVFNEKYQSYTYFSLQHQAKALLGIIQEAPHNAATDAILSVRLYNLYKHLETNGAEMGRAHKALLLTTIDASFAKQNPEYDGVCMGNKKTCTCGAPFFF